ncbi:hypothetical protein Tco_1016902 [Tanacetum coccineum]|uniref:Integrase, catalytic region, zinc finger, CCHC-type, peptidase aspartic, catalytic n=1 Tax=Tanacetum coccineum TaxID=301880 RepID=A0ABQ5FSJ3_9ASTR
MQGTSLTKQERKCNMYDAFDKFTHIKVETLHKYYLRFTHLINDMNIYNMKKEQFQVNTKFLNSLPPEWSKFMTDVKLVKDLHTTNFDQLHAYLEQHELHTNEVRLLRERNQDPLAFVANQQMTPSYFNTYQSSYNNPQLQQHFSPSQYGSIHHTQHYSLIYPSQPQFNHSSIPPSCPYQSQMNHQTSPVPKIAYQSPQVSTQPMTESPLVDSSFVVPVFSLGDDPIARLNKAIAFLTAVASSRFPSTNNQLRTSSNPRNQATIQDSRVIVQQVQRRQGKFILVLGIRVMLLVLGETMQVDMKGLLNAITVKTKDLDTYDSDCDDISNAKAVLMANISNYGSDVISEVPHSETYLNDMENQGYQNPFYLRKAQRIKPTLYDGIVMSDKHVAMPVIDDDETLILEEESRSKIFEKGKDPEVIKKSISHKPIDYEKLNRLSDDFRKHFTPQQELSAKQAFWLCISNPTSKSSDASPVKREAPKELPKISLVNESLKKLKFHLAMFDNVVKIRTTPDARTEGEWGFEHTKAVFNNEIIPFLKSLKDIFNVFDRDLLNEIMEVHTVFDQMDVAVQQSSVDKQCLKIAKK